jgi:hypothetical protein
MTTSSALLIAWIILYAAATCVWADIIADCGALQETLWGVALGWNTTSSPDWCCDPSTPAVGVTCGMVATTRRVVALRVPGYASLHMAPLTGPLPASLGRLTALQILDVSMQGLTGGLDVISTLTALVSLNMSFNALSGSLLACTNLSTLATLWLGDNALSGTVTPLASLSASLLDLHLGDRDPEHSRGNTLSGRVLPVLAGLSRLERVNVNNNLFDDHVTGSFYDLLPVSTLQRAQLAGNRLFGANVDITIDHWPHLLELNISNNLLSGTLHVQISNTDYAGILDTSLNDFVCPPPQVCVYGECICVFQFTFDSPIMTFVFGSLVVLSTWRF